MTYAHQVDFVHDYRAGFLDTHAPRCAGVAKSVWLGEGQLAENRHAWARACSRP